MDKYTFVKEIMEAQDRFLILSSLTVEQGQMVQWDESNRRAIVMTAAAAIFLGVAMDRNPYAGLTELTDTSILVKGKGIHKFKTTTSETYTHGKKVAMGADAQTVTTAIAGKTVIGEVHLPGGESVTGAAGVDIAVNLFGFGSEKFPQGVQDIFVSIDTSAANTPKEYPLMVAPWPLTVVEAQAIPQAAVAAGTGNTYYNYVLRNKGTAGSGTTQVGIVSGSGTAFTAFVPSDLGSIANADVAKGEVLAMYLDQKNPGVASPETVVRLRVVPRI